jgi:hypothetical protein
MIENGSGYFQGRIFARRFSRVPSASSRRKPAIDGMV